MVPTFMANRERTQGLWVEGLSTNSLVVGLDDPMGVEVGDWMPSRWV